MVLEIVEIVVGSIETIALALIAVWAAKVNKKDGK